MVQESHNQEVLNESKSLSSPFKNASQKPGMNLAKDLISDGETTDAAVATSNGAAAGTAPKPQGFRHPTPPSPIKIGALDPRSNAELRQPQFPSGAIQQPQFPSGAIQQPHFYSGEIQQPQFDNGEIQQPQFHSGEIQQPQFPSGAIKQPQFPSGAIKQPQFSSGEIRQPQFPSGAIRQPQFPSGAIRQPQFPSSEIRQPKDIENAFASRKDGRPPQSGDGPKLPSIDTAGEVTNMFTPEMLPPDGQANGEQERDIGGDYKLGEQLGRGGCAIVYEAWRRSDNQHVAVKVLQLPAMLERNEAIIVKRRFNREAKLITSLNEEHIVKCIDYGSLDGVPCMVLEFVSGEPLDGYLTNYGALPVGYALGIVRQLLLALETSHRQGIIHRDIKPSNIMMFDMPPPYEIRVLDFGISTVMDGFEQDGLLLTQAGTVRGTPAYMAPELFTGETGASVESDLYAVGLVLLEALTAEVAFYGETFVQTAYKHVNSPLVVPDFIEPSLAAIITKCCEKDTQKRYHAARDIIIDLDACTPRAISYEEKYERHGGKRILPSKSANRPLVIAVVSVLCIGALFIALWLLMPVSKSDAPLAAGVPNIRPLATPIQFVVLAPSAKDIDVAKKIVFQAWQRSLEILPTTADAVSADSNAPRTPTTPNKRRPITKVDGRNDANTPGRVKDNTAIPGFLLK